MLASFLQNGAKRLMGVRHIHPPYNSVFENGTKPLVIVGNNSVLFSTLDALKRFGSEKYKGITFVYPPFWLDGIHKDYKDLAWGQTMYGLPRTVRERFHKIRPHYPEDKPIMWGDYQAVREEALNELTKYPNVNMIKGSPSSVDDANKMWRINFLQRNEPCFIDKNSVFYGLFTKPFIPKQFEGARPHVEIYALPRTEIPKKMIVVGHGLSVIWLLRDFPTCEFINFKLPGEKFLKIASNADVDIEEAIESGRLKIFDADQYELHTTTNTSFGYISKKNKSEAVVEPLPLYLATGLVTDHNIFRLIPNTQKFLFPQFDEQLKRFIYSPGQLEKGLEARNFVATRDVFPGALAGKYTFIMNLSDNVGWTANPMFYYSKSHHEALKELAREHNLELRIDYFDALDKKIETLEKPLNSTQSIALYLEIFNEICKNATSIEVQTFKKVLENFFEQPGQENSSTPVFAEHERRKKHV